MAGIDGMKTVESLATLIHEDRSDDGTRYFWVTIASDAIPVLVAALRKCARLTSGPAVEEVLTRIAESGDPPWAEELEFDSEADGCTVRCNRKTPLIFLLRRFERRLAKPAALRRLVRSLPSAD